MRKDLYLFLVSGWILLSVGGPWAAADEATGSIEGTVRLAATGDTLARAGVSISNLGRKAETDAAGRYRFAEVPPGKYEVMAHLHPLSDSRRSIEVTAGQALTVDFALTIAPIHEEVTVTAAGRSQMPLETFQSVSSLELADLATRAAASLGDVLEGELGVAKRSYGPGSSRPVVRGFDGDRLLILQDGMPTGTLSSQSGDHGEPIDVGTVDRIEIVRGPATLLYGTNAIGGAINVITDHHQEHEHAHEGVRGFLTGSGGSGNGQAGGSGGLEAGIGKWLLVTSGGGSRTGDYRTPLGKVDNSGTELRNSAVSLGRFGERGIFRVNYRIQNGLYGIPFDASHQEREGDHEDHVEEGHAYDEGPVDLKWRRHNVRFSGGLNDLGPALEKLSYHMDYSNWNHREMVGGLVGTKFFNRQLSYRTVFSQRPRGGVIGSFGVNGIRRSYDVRGDEQVTPAVTQDGLAVFALEEIALPRARLQLGGRLETNRYSPKGAPDRSFTGFSGSAGINTRLWRDGAFVTSYSYTYRAPAVEELYNAGPHHGNMAYEIGNPELGRERANGLEMGLRHRASRVHAEANFFYYRIGDYVYLAPTGDFEHGLKVAEYSQGDTRYVGGEALLHMALRPNLWLNLGLDAVDAQLRHLGQPLPRIPPLRGRVGLNARLGNLSLQPELVLTDSQDRLYSGETRTAGYALANLTSSYTLTRKHALHIVSLNFFNATGRLYRNHASLIKEYAPEIGRGVRLAYTVRFF
ncbi:MAG TPA: TonB-dependent receptor [Bryobacteraceae bacterium]|nr:TonB-dependent receptor [Bryobacteraceae bacterium]